MTQPDYTLFPAKKHPTKMSGKDYLEKQSEDALWNLFFSQAQCQKNAAGDKKMAEFLAPFSEASGHRSITHSTWQKYRITRVGNKWKAFSSKRKEKFEITTNWINPEMNNIEADSVNPINIPQALRSDLYDFWSDNYQSENGMCTLCG